MPKNRYYKPTQKNEGMLPVNSFYYTWIGNSFVSLTFRI